MKYEEIINKPAVLVCFTCAWTKSHNIYDIAVCTHEKVSVAKIDINKNPELVLALKITTPTILLYKDGIIAQRFDKEYSTQEIIDSVNTEIL